MIKKGFSINHSDSLPKVEILIKGYYSLNETCGHVCSTITLVEDRDLKIIVDPGTLPDPGLVFQELEKRNLSVDDINIVFITHSHMDHIKYTGLFSKAKILDYWGWWQGDLWKKSTAVISDYITVLETPGHSFDSITLMVKTGIGMIAICGDVFWERTYPKKPEDDAFASHPALLGKSRKKLLAEADYIIPGHGDMFRVSESTT